MLGKLIAGAFGLRKGRIVARARSGDPLSIGLVFLYFILRYFRNRSKTAYSTKLEPGQSLIVTHFPKENAKGGF